LQSNAIKFTQKGHVKHLISIEDDYLKFEIEDTGLGIKPEDQKHLFKVFGRV
jgi:signal transduction histidine kinase